MTLTADWLITVAGKPHRKSHRLRPNGSTVCGQLGPSAKFRSAPGTVERCQLCITLPVDYAQALSNYTPDERECWIWGGYMDDNGYGRASVGGVTDWAHRVSYQHHVGPIPDRHEIDHTCQVTACMNPAHLEAVTKVEHAARTFARLGKNDLHGMAARLRHLGLTYGEIADALDMAGAGSAAGAVKAAVKKGLIDAESVPPARRLTEGEREDMRSMYLFGISQPEIARFYNIDASQVSRICSGRSSGWSATAPEIPRPRLKTGAFR